MESAKKKTTFKRLFRYIKRLFKLSDIQIFILKLLLMFSLVLITAVLSRYVPIIDYIVELIDSILLFIRF